MFCKLEQILTNCFLRNTFCDHLSIEAMTPAKLTSTHGNEKLDDRIACATEVNFYDDDDDDDGNEIKIWK